MQGFSRRGVLKAAIGAPVGWGTLSSLRGDQPAASAGLVEVDIEAQQSWITVGGQNALLFGFNGLVPGPVIEAHPGDHIRVRFRNSLPAMTNLHYHGLHVTPTGNGDNSFPGVGSGEGLTYEFDLPANHPGGTFWYHPHMHGSVARQVSRGLAGVFIVRGELDQIPEIAAAPEAILVLQDFDLSGNGIPVEPSQMARMTGREGGLITISGQINPSVGLQRDGWVRVRILNVSSSRFYRLQLEEHPLYLIASDGDALQSPDARDEVLLTPGERVEVMVKGTRPGGSYRLLSLPCNRGGMEMMSAGLSDLEVLATLIYEGQAATPWSLPQRLVNFDALPAPSVRRSFQLGQGMGMGMGMMGAGGMTLSINGRAFNPERVDTRVALGSVEDGEFINPMMMDHPMHIHTNPFQMIGPDGTPNRAWKDVVLLPAFSRVHMRTAFRDFAGLALYHCHILDHEDLGMMGTLQIQG